MVCAQSKNQPAGGGLDRLIGIENTKIYREPVTLCDRMQPIIDFSYFRRRNLETELFE